MLILLCIIILRVLLLSGSADFDSYHINSPESFDATRMLEFASMIRDPVRLRLALHSDDFSANGLFSLKIVFLLVRL
jgi:hypothetical protein